MVYDLDVGRGVDVCIDVNADVNVNVDVDADVDADAEVHVNTHVYDDLSLGERACPRRTDLSSGGPR